MVAILQPSENDWKHSFRKPAIRLRVIIVGARVAGLSRPTPTGDAAYRILVPRERMQSDPETLNMISENAAIRWMGQLLAVYTSSRDQWTDLPLQVPKDISLPILSRTTTCTTWS
ncbi:unnamed protein product [Aureobasidium uvarum]|uniref:Uncharacterized protein n=1 Tax=Aureobasidium uvarum TaxID=2773716 RepID=A0A9N8PX52_9PEZI|nr:unnamed protein product [Aureobasidium uvarum]